MYVKSCHTANVLTTMAGTSPKWRKNPADPLRTAKKYASHKTVFAISSQRTPGGTKLLEENPRV